MYMGHILLYTKNTTHCYINCHGNQATLCTYRYTNKPGCVSIHHCSCHNCAECFKFSQLSDTNNSLWVIVIHVSLSGRTSYWSSVGQHSKTLTQTHISIIHSFLTAVQTATTHSLTHYSTLLHLYWKLTNCFARVAMHVKIGCFN